MNTNLNNETLDQKIDRLNRTIVRCVFQINDKRNTQEIIDTFIRAKAEAERQLAAAKKEKAAQNKPASDTPAQNSATSRKTASNPTTESVVGEACGKSSAHRMTFQNAAQNTDTTQHTHVVTAVPRQTLLVKIEWVDTEKAPVVLGQGEVLNRFTRTLRDCAESQTAQTENWDKLVLSKQFDTLCLYYRAYALFPRPSQQPLPTQEDMGPQYFVGNARKKIWELIRETVKPDVNQ